MVPQLTTAGFTQPDQRARGTILESMPHRALVPARVDGTYAAVHQLVDLRNAGFKLAPVDTNLFPSLFNQLTDEMLPLAVQAAMAAIEKICPEAKNLLLVPTAAPRTRTTVQRAAADADLHPGRAERAPGHAGRDRHRSRHPVLPDGSELVVEPLLRTRTPRAEELRPWHDPAQRRSVRRSAAGARDLHEQYLLPPLHAGWTVRRKSRHFQSYEKWPRNSPSCSHGPLADQPHARAVRRGPFGTPRRPDRVRGHAEPC